MFDLTTAKTRLNIAVATRDAEVQGMLDAALAIAEKYCNRGFLYKAERVHFYDTTANSLPLPRYPVEQVTKVSVGGKYHVHKQTGLIAFHDRNLYGGCAGGGTDVTVEYAGGYRTLPADLELALWEIFDNLWSRHNASASGAVAAATSGVVQSITSDGATIRYDTSGGAAASTPNALNLETGVPFSAQSILDLYRREVA